MKKGSVLYCAALLKRGPRGKDLGFRVFHFLFAFIFCLTTEAKAQLRDPTAPLVNISGKEESKVDTKFHLESILLAPNRKLALINGQWLGIGSSIADARVLAIGKNHVVLFCQQRKQTLYLFGRRLWKAH